MAVKFIDMLPITFLQATRCARKGQTTLDLYVAGYVNFKVSEMGVLASVAIRHRTY